MRRERDDGGEDRNPDPDQQPALADARQREERADDRAQQRVRRFPESVGERNLVDDELRQKQDEREIWRTPWLARNAATPPGKLLRQQEVEAVEEEEDGPGVQAGRGGETEPGQDRRSIAGPEEPGEETGPVRGRLRRLPPSRFT